MFDMSKVAAWREAGEAKVREKKAAEDRPVEILDEQRWLAKQAAFGIDDVRALATFLNTKHEAGLNVNAPTEELETQIMDFIEGTQDVNPAVLAAGIQGLSDVRDSMQDTAEEPTPVEHVPGLETMNKLARYGAGVLFKQPNGKYLLQENQPTDVDDATDAGKLRPAGGGKHKGDANLRATILREMNEEFGITPEEAKPNLALLGYNTVKNRFRDCAIFVMEDHGLKPGWYQASNSAKEKIKLVEADLDDPKYIGPKLSQLRRYSLRGYRGRGSSKEASVEPAGRFLTDYELQGYAVSVATGLARSLQVDETFEAHDDEQDA
jgi:8-oxo-dGTP pyrophosphatase MutT (NUDIX family)